MKKIMSGRTYNTATATPIEISEKIALFSGLYIERETLYLTPTKNWFVYSLNCISGNNNLQPRIITKVESHSMQACSPEDARLWLEECGKAEAIARYFTSIDR
jgi:hypothetical protein